MKRLSAIPAACHTGGLAPPRGVGTAGACVGVNPSARSAGPRPRPASRPCPFGIAGSLTLGQVGFGTRPKSEAMRVTKCKAAWAQHIGYTRVPIGRA